MSDGIRTEAPCAVCGKTLFIGGRQGMYPRQYLTTSVVNGQVDGDAWVCGPVCDNKYIALRAAAAVRRPRSGGINPAGTSRGVSAIGVPAPAMDIVPPSGGSRSTEG